MGFFLAESPQKTVNGFDVKFNAVHQKIQFKFFRGDFFIDSISDDGTGKAQILTTQEFTAEDISPGFTITIYNASLYKGTFEILSVIDQFTFIIDTPFIGTESVYIVCDARKNWALITKVLWYDNGAVSFEEIASLIYKADKEYAIKINPAPILKNKVVFTDKNHFVLDNLFYDKSDSGKFKIQVTEFYNGTNAGTYTSGEFYYTNSINQLPDFYNYAGNMAEFVLQDPSFPIPKLLGAFVEPTYFYGFPFSISLLSLFEDNTKYEILQPNGSNFETNILTLSNEYINRFNLSNIADPTAHEYITFAILGEQTGDFFPLNTPLKIDIKTGCQDNTIYLNWLHYDGSRNFWLFEEVIIESINTETISTFEPYYEDTYLQQVKIQELEIKAEKEITVSSIVPTEKAKGILTILHSINVLMYLGLDQDSLPYWEQIRIEKGSFRMFEKNDTNVEISFNFTRPYINIQSQ